MAKIFYIPTFCNITITRAISPSRLLWVASCIGSVVFCLMIIVPIVQKFDKDPTIISIEDTNYPVWKVNFPAVTICSNNKVVSNNFVKALKRPP